MKCYPTPLLLALILSLVLSCNKDTDLALQAKLAEMNLLKNNFALAKESRQKKIDTLSMELSAEYPAAPPFGHDSTRRIIRYPLAPSLNGVPFWKLDTIYIPARETPEAQRVLLNERFYGQKYYVGAVSYLDPKQKTNIRGVVVTITDVGHIPTWYVQMNNNMLEKGENSHLFGAVRRNFDLERKVDYKGHTWQVWVPNRSGREGLGKSVKGDMAAFTSFWNQRFIVTMLELDTSSSKIETFYKLVDVDWLEKLKSPRH